MSSFTIWGCDKSEFSPHILERVMTWRRHSPPRFWGVYLADYSGDRTVSNVLHRRRNPDITRNEAHRLYQTALGAFERSPSSEPDSDAIPVSVSLSETISELHDRDVRVLPIFNRVTDRVWNGNVVSHDFHPPTPAPIEPGSDMVDGVPNRRLHRQAQRAADFRRVDEIAERHGRAAARRAAEIARGAKIPQHRVRIYADLESDNVVSWIFGWTDEIRLQRYLPGLYGNHRSGWGANLRRFITTRATNLTSPWYASLKVFAAQRNRDHRNRIPTIDADHLPDAISEDAAGHVASLNTAVFQAKHSARIHDVVVDMDWATTDGFAEMF